MKEELKKTECLCPYCEEEISQEAVTFCQPCQIELGYCRKCDIMVESKAELCPQCGQSLE